MDFNPKYILYFLTLALFVKSNQSFGPPCKSNTFPSVFYSLFYVFKKDGIKNCKGFLYSNPSQYIFRLIKLSFSVDGDESIHK